MKKKHSISILHIFNEPKFSVGFFNFLIKHGFNLERHFLFHYRCSKNKCENYGMRHLFAANFFSIFPNLLLLKHLFDAEKILIHSLASPFLLIYLCLFPSLGKKTFWAIWGKDLYFYYVLDKPRIYHRIYEYFRKKAILNIEHIITYTIGDYERAKDWYKSTAKLHLSFGYTSNLYQDPGNDYRLFKAPDGPIKILIGNSADPSNLHLEIFEKLAKYKNHNIKLITPLSYGNMVYAEKVSKQGKLIFGDKFEALDKLLPYPQYQQLLKNIDIAIFAHKRQQATGNIITLLSYGKKVYLRDSVSTWDLFTNLGISLFKWDNFSLTPVKEEVMLKNIEILKNTFCEKNLAEQWQRIFNYQFD